MIVLTRTDRLGDVLLTLPAVVHLRNTLPSTHFEFLVRPEYRDVIGPFLSPSQVEARNTDSYQFTNRIESIIFFFHDKRLVTEAWKNRIKTRWGIFSKPSSFILLSSGVRQKRSRAEKNEAEYNLELADGFLQQLGIQPPKWITSKIELPANHSSVEMAHMTLSKLGFEKDEPFIVMHPGMGGSALNLSPQQYRDIALQLSRQYGAKILVSAGPAMEDRKMIERLRPAEFGGQLLEGLSLSELMEVFRLASVVVAPSTGPLHLAHYVGTPTIGIYPPLRSHHPRRWAPWGGSGHHETIYPDQIPCPGSKECLGDACSYFFCMDSVPWAQLVSRAAIGNKENHFVG
jgi:heptosyltransferase III